MMADVADDDGEQTEQEHNAGCIDDRMQRLDARREILHTAEVLRRRRLSHGLSDVLQL